MNIPGGHEHHHRHHMNRAIEISRNLECRNIENVIFQSCLGCVRHVESVDTKDSVIQADHDTPLEVEPALVGACTLESNLTQLKGVIL